MGSMLTPSIQKFRYMRMQSANQGKGSWLMLSVVGCIDICLFAVKPLNLRPSHLLHAIHSRAAHGPENGRLFEGFAHYGQRRDAVRILAQSLRRRGDPHLGAVEGMKGKGVVLSLTPHLAQSNDTQTRIHTYTYTYVYALVYMIHTYTPDLSTNRSRQADC